MKFSQKPRVAPMPGTQLCPRWPEWGGIRELPLAVTAHTMAGARWISWSSQDASPSKALLQTSVWCRCLQEPRLLTGTTPGAAGWHCIHKSTGLQPELGMQREDALPRDFPRPLLLADPRDAEVRKGQEAAQSPALPEGRGPLPGSC